MEIIETGFKGLFLVRTNVFIDSRGVFIKTFNREAFRVLGLETDFSERYYSVSKKDVIRGMHFQRPPAEHVKVVNVIQGRIIDVVVDIRKESVTFGRCFSAELNGENGEFIYIPKGFAHGFRAMTDNAIVEYNQTSGYDKAYDCGISWDSIPFDWGVSNPVMSDRDRAFESLETFKSPF